jgi:hypothetical protein
MCAFPNGLLLVTITDARSLEYTTRPGIEARLADR